MELYVSLSTYGGVSTREALEVFWQAGIRHVELAIGPRPDNDATQAISDFQQQGMVYRGHHAFVWGNHHHPFNLAQPLDLNYFQQLTEWLANNGIAAYSVHGGSFDRETTRGQAYETFVENIDCLYQLCHKQGIVFGVETMYPTSPNSGVENLLDNLSELEQFCQDIPQVKIVLDLAHMNIWRHCSVTSKLEWLKLPAERVLEIHLSDNDGRHDIHSRITPKTWWVPYISNFPRGVAWVMESRLNRLPVSVISQECESIKGLMVTEL